MKIKNKIKIFTYVLFISLCCFISNNCFTYIVNATQENTEDLSEFDNYNYIPITEKINGEDYQPKNDDSVLPPIYKDTNTSSSFDLRDIGASTSIKSQGSDGMCWAFATLASCESNILLNNIDYSEAWNLNNELNLSEEQIGYYLYTPAKSEINSHYGDYINQKNKGSSGGNALHASFYLSTTGVTLEQDIPYTGVKKELSEYQRKSSRFRLKESEIIMNYSPDNDVATIKSWIMNSGAVYIAYHNNSSNYYDNGTTHSYYQNEKDYYSATHAVTIIGWDDNYDGFNPENSPEEKGAWLIKNSWGTDTLDDGYFWMSYYDTSIGECTRFSMEKVPDEEQVYSYDGSGYVSAYQFEAGANVFVADDNQTLTDIGFYQCSANGKSSNYNIKIYLLNDDWSDPTDGKLINKTSGICGRYGYKEVPLSEPVQINSGEQFSVVLSMDLGSSRSGKNYGYMTIEEEYVGKGSFDMNCSSNAGESFIYEIGGEQWEDTSQIIGMYGILGNLNIRAIAQSDKSDKLNISQLDKALKSENASDMESYNEGVETLFKAARNQITQTELDCISEKLLSELEYSKNISFPKYYYENYGITLGDADLNGDISVDDASTVLTMYARKSAGLCNTFRSQQKAAADMDMSCSISVDDASRILDYYAKKAAGLLD